MARIDLELPDDILAHIHAAAAARGITMAEVVTEALLRFQDDADLEAALAVAEADVAAGRVTDADIVFARLEARSRALRLREAS